MRNARLMKQMKEFWNSQIFFCHYLEVAYFHILKNLLIVLILLQKML